MSQLNDRQGARKTTRPEWFGSKTVARTLVPAAPGASPITSELLPNSATARAFQFLPPAIGTPSTVLDPAAGGGSIPFEAARLGLETISNDLNPVAALLLKTTIELPTRFGTDLLRGYERLAGEFIRRAAPHFVGLFPEEPAGVITVDGYLWARTVTCPYCGGVVPLWPNWKVDSSGHGVRLLPADGHVRFEIVDREADHSPGTVKGGDGTCPFPECRRTIDGDEIKAQAQAGRMGHQLYCVVYKEERIKGYTKSGKPKMEKVRGFRAPRPEDDVEGLVQQKLAEKIPLWQARNIVPDEEFPPDTNDDRPLQYGAPTLARSLQSTATLRALRERRGIPGHGGGVRRDRP
jgi:putative DNA methylase